MRFHKCVGTCLILGASLMCGPATSAPAQGQSAPQRKPASLPNQPEALVRSLYAEVVARHPLGISVGGDMKIFAPYLSKALLHRIELANACLDDWYRQNPDPNSKPPGLEGGLFTADDLRAEPHAFRIEGAQAEKGGSIRVRVRLTHNEPGESPWTWHVAAILVRENGRLVVDDVIYLKDSPQDLDVRLSEYLSQGCDGPRWVGYGKSKRASLPNQPEALVQSLYAEVVARHPIGAPEGVDMKIFAPYLSKALLHKMDLAIACVNDWHRQNPDPHLKPAVGWMELGPFSGENERASPQTFLIEKTQSEKDGSYRVYVRLTRTYLEGPPSIWRVAVIVIRENSRFVVDDVIYLKDEDYDEGRLSKAMSAGCDGPRWVGYGKSKRASLPNQPEALIRSLYAEVVARHPLGVPDDANMKVFTPYLSKRLLHKLDLANACGNDWHRKNPDPHLKPELSWLELGPFSGDNERFSPQTFLIERTQSEKDGSFRVYVRLTRAYREGPPSIWRVAVIVIRENSRFVVDDVIYLKDEELDVEDRLSGYLSAGCDGPRWVGYGKSKRDSKKK